MTELSYYALSGGRKLNRSNEILQMISQLVERLNNPLATAYYLMSQETICYFNGRWLEAIQFGKRADEMLRSQGVGLRYEMNQTQICWLNSLFFSGQLKELAERLQGLVKEAQDRSDIMVETFLRLVVLYRVLLAADRPDQAEIELSEAVKKWSNKGFQFPHWWCALGRTCVALYCGEGQRAWQLINEQWAAFNRSFFSRGQLTYIFSHHLHAYCAIAAARNDNQKEALLRIAEKNAIKIERENMAWAYPIARVIRAGIAMARGDNQTAIKFLEQAEAEFRAVDMLLYATAAQRRRAQLLGADAGRKLIDEADQWMNSQKIKSPQRMTNMLVPAIL
jgi:tetratricopeptide (TPR) repeat protein